MNTDSVGSEPPLIAGLELDGRPASSPSESDASAKLWLDAVRFALLGEGGAPAENVALELAWAGQSCRIVRGRSGALQLSGDVGPFDRALSLERGDRVRARSHLRRVLELARNPANSALDEFTQRLRETIQTWTRLRRPVARVGNARWTLVFAMLALTGGGAIAKGVLESAAAPILLGSVGIAGALLADRRARARRSIADGQRVDALERITRQLRGEFARQKLLLPADPLSEDEVARAFGVVRARIAEMSLATEAECALNALDQVPSEEAPQTKVSLRTGEEPAPRRRVERTTRRRAGEDLGASAG